MNQKKAVAVLERRKAALRRRTAGRPVDRVSYDLAEIAAIERVIATAQDAVAERNALHREARRVMDLLEEYGPSIVGHLLDTDDNAGQRLRELLDGGR